MKKFIDFTMERDPFEEYLKRRSANSCDSDYRLRDLSDYELRVVKLNDDNDTIIETVFTNCPYAASDYFHYYINCEHRKRLSPNLVSVSFSTGPRPPLWWRRRNPTPIMEKPIATVSFCFRGTHCFVYDADGTCRYYSPRDDPTRTRRPFREFLEDRRITFVGIGIGEFVEKAKEQWGCHVAKAVDLRALVGEVKGKGRVFEWRKKGKGLEMEGLGLEEMAELVLDGMKVRKKSKKVVTRETDRSRDEAEDEEMLLYSTRDAYLSFVIARKCFAMIGRKI